jgi:diadenosine tetraphosphate (Ap4A) HIT family hydrolase
MKYTELLQFLTEKMKMSHIYQPVVIKSLFQNNGELSDYELSKRLLEYDVSQIEYYQNIVNKMVGKVLRNHNIISKNDLYLMIDFELYSNSEKENIIKICDEKINQFIKNRGDSAWAHRNFDRNYISGTIRYDVLKRANFRCELCGISADKKALEVDHIVPVSKKGEDSINNYQALCYSCNASKNNRDNKDFRNLNDMFQYREDKCLFCDLDKSRIIIENNLAYAIYDGFPVTKLHSLIIPKRHVSEYFALTQPEINACNELLMKLKDSIQLSDNLVKGFNIGINNGEVAGQTIFHCHIHLIPRRENDVENPKGGVRHLIPGKGFY